MIECELSTKITKINMRLNERLVECKNKYEAECEAKYKNESG